MATKKKVTRHGATQPEDEREAVQVLLRLLPKTRRELDAMAKRWGLTRSEAVTELVERAKDERRP